MSTTFDIYQFDIPKFDAILSRGLSRGLGDPGDQVCIEAAICECLGLPHSDDPGCVAVSVRSYKIALNDSSRWKNSMERAKHLRDLGIAQLGSLGVVDDQEFTSRLAEKTIRILIPQLFREVFPNNKECLAAADRCEQEGTKESAHAADSATAAYSAAYATYAAATNANAATSYSAFSDSAAASAYYAAATSYAASYAAAAANAAAAAAANATAAYAADAGQKYLVLSASLALETLRELKSPGVQLLEMVA